MRTIIVCLLILLLAACSNKKTPPDDSEENRALTVWENKEGRISLLRSYWLEASASSELPDHPARNLLDVTWESWAEGAAGNGIGESFTLTWSSYFEKNYRGTYTKTVAGFALKNGYGDLDLYRQNNRVKSFKIYVDGNYTETIPIEDSINFEQYVFEKPVTFEDLRFVIDDVYPGTRFNDTYVAEIGLLSKPANAKHFYEDILLSFDSGDIDNYYWGHNREIVSVPDTDRLLLLDYLPFVDNIYRFRFYQERIPRETKIALLDGESSLRLGGIIAGDNLPRLDGATAMYPLYSSFVRAVYPQMDLDWEETGKEYSYEEMKAYTRALYKWPYFPNTDLLFDVFSASDLGIAEAGTDNEDLGSIVQCNKTSRAFQRLIDGETDIIFCYEPSEAEKNAAEEKGKQFTLTPIAHDAFVFIVNEKNNLTNITQQQIRDIYSGRVTNWKSISGVDELVIAYQRPENSGSQTTLQSIMRGDRLIRTIMDGEIIPKGMGGMIRAISSSYHNYNSAIGYTFLFYLTQMAGGSGVKALALDGIPPTRQTIQNKTYPFTQTVYAITTGNESENTKKFIEWILSVQGQELVAKTGYTQVK